LKTHILLIIGLIYSASVLTLASMSKIGQDFSYQIPTICLFALYAYNLYLSSKEVPDIRKEIMDELQKRDEYLQGLKNEVSKVSMSVTRSGAFNEKIRF